LLHPQAKEFQSQVDLAACIKPGDLIMVMAPSGHWHHGIFYGWQMFGNFKQLSVVDVWGPTKEQATISVRTLHDFVKGGVRFAKAVFEEGSVPPREKSKEIAQKLLAEAERIGFQYNGLFNNCEHFATLCRCGRWVGVYASHSNLMLQLANIPVPKQSHDNTFSYSPAGKSLNKLAFYLRS